ncbi:GerMN domain-containing protein [Funiculus sociatus]|nr:GerMN domain-containing protein [Trichocoleus sp. FACHB-69]
MKIFMRQPTLLNFCLFVAFVGISGCGSQTINAMSSQRLSPVESLTNATISQQTNLTKQATPAVSAQAPAAVKKVKVFFPKNIRTSQDFTYVEPVLRTTSSASVAQFAIEQLIAGPTSQEKARGLSDPIEFKGTSNCGKDFTLSITNGTAKLKFCKSVISGGTGDDARQKSSINNTLKQFPTINSVIILDRNGNCLSDQSGENTCLKKAEKLTTESGLSIDGLGSVKINMTVAQASSVAGTQIVPSRQNPNRVCDYYKPANGPEGVTFMVTEGRIATVEVETNKITTVHGIKVDDTESTIKSAYPGQIQVSRLLNSEKGKAWVLQPSSFANKDFRLVFVSPNGKTVSRMIAGKVPEVNYAEGCLDVRPV